MANDAKLVSLADLKAGLEGYMGQIGSAYTIKGSVTTQSNLPTSGNKAGDMYIAQDTGISYVYTGSKWVSAGTKNNASIITSAQIDAAIALVKNNI